MQEQPFFQELSKLSPVQLLEFGSRMAEYHHRQFKWMDSLERVLFWFAVLCWCLSLTVNYLSFNLMVGGTVFFVGASFYGYRSIKNLKKSLEYKRLVKEYTELFAAAALRQSKKAEP